MKIVLSKIYSGLNNDITYNTRTKSVTTGTENIFWQGKRVNVLLRHMSKEPLSTVCSDYDRIIKCLNIDDNVISWIGLLSSSKIKHRVKDQLAIFDEISTMYSTYYDTTLPQRISLFDRLEQFIFKDKLHKSLTYAHDKTVTGRTIITSGLNLMTMKKEDRSLLESKYEKGSIVELDIKSLEPRLYLKLIKGVDVVDAYTFLLTEVLEKQIGDIPRKKIKLAFISLLYGASERKIKFMTSLKAQDVRKIKKYLAVNELKQKIEMEFKENGYFENAYGRKIFSINAPVNYYIQSTAADYACLLYEELLSSIDDNRLDLIGVIHDAILLDVAPERIDEIISITSAHESIINITAHLNIVRHS
jgi:hypothetical protein